MVLNNINNNLSEHRKLKFLFILSDKYPPFRVDVAELFGKELAGRGHHIDWILQSEAVCSHSYRASALGGTVWVGATDCGTSIFNRLRKHFLSILNDLRIFRILKREKYDFIQVRDKFFAAIFAIIAARMFKTKFIYWLSFPFPEAYIHYAKARTARYPMLSYIRGYSLKWLVYRVLIPKADYLFVQSEQMKRDFADAGVPLEKMTPVPMGVSLDMFPFVSDENQAKKNTESNNIVYLGTFNSSRKLDFLVRVFKQVLECVPGSKLYFVGGSDDEADQKILEEESKRLGLQDNVVFTGFLPREEAFQYVKAANVCVSPFYPTPILNSTSPTKLVEYMAMGKPVVANDHPEQRLTIEQSQAGICVPYSEGAFADAIVELLMDRERSAEMGISGRAYVEEHRNYQHIAAFVEEEYYRICGI